MEEKKLYERHKKCKCKLENGCNKHFIKWQKTFAEEASKKQTKAINNELNEIK